MSRYLDHLLAPIGPAPFVDRYYQQLPIAVPAAALQLTPLGTCDVLETIRQHPESKIQRSRRGELLAGEHRPTADELQQSLADGWTIFVRHAERFYPPLAELAEEFRATFEAPIDVHFFCTPAETEGFGWHYDVEDVFILQTAGSKKYRLRKNTVNPWPLAETMPDDLSYEAERSLPMECRLNAGDWLYIPAGYWHATSAEADSISLSVGVMSPTAIHLFDVMRPFLTDSLRWRQRIPLTGDIAGVSADEARDRLRGVFWDLADDFARELKSDEAIDRFMKWRAGYGKSSG